MCNPKYLISACLLAGLAAAPAALASHILTYQITTDTYLDSANSSKNYGLSGSDKVVINSTSMCRTVFGLPAGLWSYAPGDIVSATVSFYVWNDNTATYNVSLFPLTTSFVTGTGSNSGTTPANGATWLTSDGTTLWATAGGDFDSVHSVVGTKGAVGVNPNDGNGRFFTWDITSLLADSTATSELQDFGAMLRIDETVPPSGQRFASFTSANSATYTAPYLPALVLTVIPEPSSLLLSVLGMAAVGWFLKRRQGRS